MNEDEFVKSLEAGDTIGFTMSVSGMNAREAMALLDGLKGAAAVCPKLLPADVKIVVDSTRGDGN